MGGGGAASRSGAPAGTQQPMELRTWARTGLAPGSRTNGTTTRGFVSTTSVGAVVVVVGGGARSSASPGGVVRAAPTSVVASAAVSRGHGVPPSSSGPRGSSAPKNPAVSRAHVSVEAVDASLKDPRDARRFLACSAALSKTGPAKSDAPASLVVVIAFSSQSSEDPGWSSSVSSPLSVSSFAESSTTEGCESASGAKNSVVVADGLREPPPPPPLGWWSSEPDPSPDEPSATPDDGSNASVDEVPLRLRALGMGRSRSRSAGVSSASPVTRT
mmetsp:Transcript_21521/g.85583  ORF Transcript_21521/g.85583 Transcript_21521/m.85583 type:complete len:273 (-) Transcript_21521:286-1104(-)